MANKAATADSMSYGKRRYDSACQESAIPPQPKVHGAVLRSL